MCNNHVTNHISERRYAMSKSLSSTQLQRLHQDILTTVKQSFPSPGYEIISHNASSTESFYVYVMFKRRLYYIRFSAHDNEMKGHAYTSFNLLNYSNWGQLQKDLRNLFLLSNKENSYKIIHYYNFVWLAIVYRCSTNPAFRVKFNPADDNREVSIYMNHKVFNKVENNNYTKRLIGNIMMGLITLNGHIDQVYFKNIVNLTITPSGEKLLDYYYKAAKYETEKRWRKDLKYMDTNSLINILKK